MALVFIGLGSNMNQPKQQLLAAKTALQHHPDINVLACSDIFQSKAMIIAGSEAQDDYLNAVIKLSTSLSAEQLLDVLQGIENQQHRVRQIRWGARTLDLDILLFGQQQIHNARLDVPHIGLAERNFVLYPLQQIAAQWQVAEQGTVAELAARITDDGIKNVGAFV